MKTKTHKIKSYIQEEMRQNHAKKLAKRKNDLAP